MKVLVVDDEPPARRRLARMLADLKVEVTDELEDAMGVLQALESGVVDALFLDVEMPGLSGLALASRALLPPVVFVTAHERYAVAAFDVQAVDYLLKPVRPERLKSAVERLRARISTPSNAASAVAGESSDAIPRIVSHSRGLAQLFDARDIARFWSSDKYTVFKADGVEHMIDEPLQALEQRLSPYGFLRIHRAELVRANAVRALRADVGIYEVILSDGQTAKVSRRALSSVRAALGI